MSGYDGNPTPEQLALADEVIRDPKKPVVATGTPLFLPHAMEMKSQGRAINVNVEVASTAR